MIPGSLMKAVLRSGEGTGKPAEGDQVRFYSLSVFICAYLNNGWFMLPPVSI